MLEIILKCISVYLAGVFELWTAIPAGMALKLNPVLISLFGALGASTAVMIVLIVGEPIRKWLMSFKKSKVDNPDSRLKKIWDKFGVPGLSVIAPLLLGAHIGAAVGLTLGGNRAKIAVWMTISCFVWSAIFTFIGQMGFSFFTKN
ncbi:MAG: small multi-drug export protein [Fibrobacteres bacterium]|nr:small multi-drug export protein [Fibrobacterota bacterium]